ncbi:uncharacterized protein [Littorina saxatilis]|uniref:Ion transport domain-containing protein n=1 Tax=Littorina saxatilis TaxID=31220 RepID=A0AAN9B974_9CAEN
MQDLHGAMLDKTSDIDLTRESPSDYDPSRVHSKRRKSGAGLGRVDATQNLGLDPVRQEASAALLGHFTKCSHDQEARVDFGFLKRQLYAGADINFCDEFGQTPLHEAARAWHTDVAGWLISHGADVNIADSFGRTPLHVAAACDCAQMVRFFIASGANTEAQTREESQTPVFFAAKYDSVHTLAELVSCGCQYKMIRDYKGRTPLHVAAETARSRTVRQLLDLGAPVGVSDYQGGKAITWMIINMPSMAAEALTQFCHTNRQFRYTYFYLNLLETDPDVDPKGLCQTPQSVAAEYRQFDIIMHPTMMALLQEKWQKFGRGWAIWRLLDNFLHAQMWTWLGIIESDASSELCGIDSWWHYLFWIFCLGHTLWHVMAEIQHYRHSRRTNVKWRATRKQAIRQDLKFCHPRWPEERAYLESELAALKRRTKVKYFTDMWNFVNWTSYVWLALSAVTRVYVSVAVTPFALTTHIQVMTVGIILVWLRLMQYLRAFTFMGAFVVMLPQLMLDTLRFLIIYLEFFCPFWAAFWMIYGGDHGDDTVEGFRSPTEVAMSLFKLTLVDEYNYNDLKRVSPQFTDWILATWWLISTFLCVNMFIAVLTETFHRVYENLKANAIMQKTITVLNIWESLSKQKKQKFFQHVHHHCSPLVADLDVSKDELDRETELQKVAFQIKEKLNGLTTAFRQMEGKGSRTNMPEADVPGKSGEESLYLLHQAMTTLQSQHEILSHKCSQDMAVVQAMLQQLTTAVREQHKTEKTNPSMSSSKSTYETCSEDETQSDPGQKQK